jgi:RNA polymerase sigma-70 factor (ECF subfamily)
MDPMPTSELVLQHGRFVQGLAHAFLRDPHAADDVAQETWVQWLRLGWFRVASPRGWLRRAVRHLAANRRRTEERRARHEALGASSEPGRSPADDAERAELCHRVVDAVFTLPEPYRATILARYFRGLAPRDLAAESGEPLATVKSRERRALETLRARLDRGHGGRAAWAALLARFGGERSIAPAASGVSALPWAAAGIGLVAAAALAWRALERDERAAAGVSGARAALVESRARASLAGEDRNGSAPAPSAGRTEVAGGPPGPATADAGGGAYALVGTTVDTRGQPLAGVELRFDRARKEVATARSDEDGHFRVESLPAFTSVSADLPDYRLLYATNPEEDPLGPYVPMRVTLAPIGELAVSVLDRGGRAVEGLTVSAVPRREELVDVAGNESTLVSGSSAIEAETDAHGRAVLRDVWTGVRLALHLDLQAGADTGEVRIDRELGGRLLLDRPAGSPIVVRAGRPLELAATWGIRHVLAGIVLDAEGEPAPECRIEVVDEGCEDGDDGRHLAWAQTDPSGRFEVSFRPPGLRGPVRVSARRTGARIPVGPEFEGTFVTISPVAWSAERLLAAEELESSESMLLTLAPAERLALVGTVRAGDGRPLDLSRHALVLLAHESAAPQRGVTCGQPGSGAFAYLGLRPGLYDLVVTARSSMQGSLELGQPAFNRFTRLPAGVELSPLALGTTAPVRLRIRGPALDLLHIVRLFPAQPRGFPRRLATSPLTIRAPAPWLAPNSLADGTREGKEGTWVVARVRAGGAGELELALGDPGWYQVRAECRGRAPLASELLYLEAGERVLMFEPPGSGTLHGRLLADGTREFLGLELAGTDGRALAPVEPIRASGEFRLSGVACGPCRLRFGSIEELRAGRWRRELALEVVPGENPALEVRL